jgi:alpha-glucosidase
LTFLPAGRYRATIWEDGATPNNVKLREVDVTARDQLALRLAAAGGAVVILERKP